MPDPFDGCTVDTAGMTPTAPDDLLVVVKKLDPCPFCDGEAADATVLYSEETQKTNEWEQNLFFYVSCVRCGSNNRGLVGHKTPEAARRHWNNRALVARCEEAGAERLRELLQLGVDAMHENGQLIPCASEDGLPCAVCDWLDKAKAALEGK